MNDERFQELLQDALLGELSEEEKAALEAELDRRGPAGARVRREIEEAFAALALDAPPIGPPPELRNRVLDSIGPSHTPVPAAPRRHIWAWIPAGMAAALALILGVSNLRLRERNERLTADLESTRERLAEADTAAARLAELRSDLELLAEPGSSILALAGTGPTPQARARVFVDPGTGRAILFAYDLPILQPGNVYQLWAIRGGTPQAAGTFRPEPAGRARLEITDPTLIDRVDALAVTVEPAPGTERPTGDMVLISSS